MGFSGPYGGGLPTESECCPRESTSRARPAGRPAGRPHTVEPSGRVGGRLDTLISRSSAAAGAKLRRLRGPGERSRRSLPHPACSYRSRRAPRLATPTRLTARQQCVPGDRQVWVDARLIRGMRIPL